MSHQHEGTVTCAMCRAQFSILGAKPVLTAHRMKVHDVYTCPNCGYYVSIVRDDATTARLATR